MSQHQSEIADIMARLRYCAQTTATKLVAELPKLLADLDHFRVFPNAETAAFANELARFLSHDAAKLVFTSQASSRAKSMEGATGSWSPKFKNRKAR